MGIGSELLIEIKGSAKEFVEALEDAKDKAGTLENKLKLTAAISGAAFGAFSAEIGLATHEFGKQEAASNSLSAALKAQGIYSNELIEKYKGQAEVQERKNGVDAESILSGQALFTTMVGQVEISDKLTQGVVDLAASMKIDAKSAYEIVARAVNGHARALTEHGISVDQNATKQQKLTQITDQLAVVMNGAAAASADGLEGKVRLLEKSFTAAQKAIGEKFAPTIERTLDKLKEIFDYLADSPELVDFAVDVLKAGVALTGIAFALGTAGVAFYKYKEAVELAKLVTTAMGISVKGLIGSTGIGLLVLVVVEVYERWGAIWPRIKGIFKGFIDFVSDGAVGLGNIILGTLTGNATKVVEGLARLNAPLKKAFDDYNKIIDASHKEVEKKEEHHETEMEKKQRELANRLAKNKANEEALQLAARNAQHAVLIAELNNESTEVVALKKKQAEILGKIADVNYKGDRTRLSQAAAENLRAIEDQQALEAQQTVTFYQESLTRSKAFQAMSSEDQAAYLKKNANAYVAQIQTLKTTREKAAKAELDLQIKTQNEYLDNQEEFGTAYAEIYKTMHSKEYQGYETAANDLSQLYQSSNDTLKGIGKAASIASITAKTAQAAMEIFAGFQSLPFGLGIPVGIAAAGAAILYGAEQIATVTAAAQGGLISGGVPGMDSVPALLMPGELVVPSRNYEEVISAVSSSRGAEGSSSPGSSSGGGYAEVQLSMKGNFMDMIEAKIVQRKRLGISISGGA